MHGTPPYETICRPRQPPLVAFAAWLADKTLGGPLLARSSEPASTASNGGIQSGGNGRIENFSQSAHLVGDRLAIGKPKTQSPETNHKISYLTQNHQSEIVMLALAVAAHVTELTSEVRIEINAMKRKASTARRIRRKPMGELKNRPNIFC
jgi:hypothetical protein